MSEPLRNMNVADIIQQSYENKPVGVEDAFNNVIQQKMADAIAARRSEIEAEMFGSEQEDDFEEEEYEDFETEEE